MSYKSLNLNQEAIEGCVHEFAQGCSGAVDGPTVKGKFLEFRVTPPGQESALLHVYQNRDGSTTLQPKVGKNQPLSDELAKHVVASTERQGGDERRPLVLGDLPQETWGFLRELLESKGCNISDEPLQHGVRISVVGPQQDRVYLHRFHTGKFTMQGRPMAVYAMVASVLSELHEDKREVLQAQLDVLQVPFTVDGLHDELRQHLPLAADYLGDTGCAIVMPALMLVKISTQFPDYSFVAFPALRGLEFYMKQLLVDNEQPVGPQQGLSAFFTSQGALKSGCAEKIKCRETIAAIEKSYEFHNQHRNALFHADGHAPVMSRIIEDRGEAANIVYDVLRIIEATYMEIHRQKNG